MEQTWLTCEILQARLEVRTIPTWEPMCVNGQHNSHLDIYSLGRSYDHNPDVGMGFPSIETPQAKPAKLEPREVSTFDVETMARTCSPRPQLYHLFISHCHQQVVRLVTDRPSRLTSFSWDLLCSLLHKSSRKSRRPLSTRPLKPPRGFCEDEPWMRQGTKHIVTMNKRTRQIKLSYYDEINLDADGKLIPIDSLLVILSSDYPLS